MRPRDYQSSMFPSGRALRDLHQREMREFDIACAIRAPRSVFDPPAVHQRGRASPAQRAIEGGARYDGIVVTLSQPGLTRSQYHSAAGAFPSYGFEL